MFRLLLLLLSLLSTGCTSALVNAAFHRVNTWDRPSRILAAYHAPDHRLTLLVQGRLPGEPAERQYVLRVPIERITTPRFDPKDPEGNFYPGYTKIPMFSRSRISFELPANLGTPISVLESPVAGVPVGAWPQPLPPGTREAIAVYNNNFDPPLFLYLPDPLPSNGAALPFMISPAVHVPYFPLIILFPVAVAADCVASPAILAFFVILRPQFDPPMRPRLESIPPKPEIQDPPSDTIPGSKPNAPPRSQSY